MVMVMVVVVAVAVAQFFWRLAHATVLKFRLTD
jgi:hypothetical protein